MADTSTVASGGFTVMEGGESVLHYDLQPYFDLQDGGRTLKVFPNNTPPWEGVAILTPDEELSHVTRVEVIAAGRDLVRYEVSPAVARREDGTIVMTVTPRA